MAEQLQAGDGTVLTVDPVDDPEKAFNQAMAAPEPSEPQAPAPPKKDPEAPYGRKADGSPKKGPGGRPPKDKATQPRMQAVKTSKASKDYTADLTGLVQAIWGVTAPFAPADAGAVQVHGPGMVRAWNDLAQENATVARGIEFLTTGTAYGAVVMATAPFVLQVLTNHGVLPVERVAVLGVAHPEEMAQLVHGTVAGMADQAAAA